MTAVTWQAFLTCTQMLSRALASTEKDTSYRLLKDKKNHCILNGDNRGTVQGRGKSNYELQSMKYMYMVLLSWKHSPTSEVMTIIKLVSISQWFYFHELYENSVLIYCYAPVICNSSYPGWLTLFAEPGLRPCTVGTCLLKVPHPPPDLGSLSLSQFYQLIKSHTCMAVQGQCKGQYTVLKLLSLQ